MVSDQFFLQFIENIIGNKKMYSGVDFIYENSDRIFEWSNLIENKCINSDKLNFDLNKKISVEDSINYAQEFFEKFELNINIKELIEKKIINFVSDEVNDRLGSVYYDENETKIELYTSDDVKFYPLIVHEIMHYLNQPNDNKRSLASDFLTEVVSYSMELIALDKFDNTEFEEDAGNFKNYILYLLGIYSYKLYSPVLSLNIYKNNGKITIEEIEKHLEFEQYKKEMDSLLKSSKNLCSYIWNTLGLYLAIYNYMEYKKDNNFIKNIISLNDNLNNKNFFECLSIIGINNYDELIDKGLNNIDEYIKYAKINLKSNL